ncbi:SAVMC3_10250 family protein [Kribbella sp. NPDC051770]|uniref:SAVMC3_10250 family protein n=1 Tax=Kribbella sp. NPDC051770 TaxID=3155413 RepID=UPI0034136D80
MRELVYLSQAKLQQFRQPGSKRDGLSGGVKLTAGLTGLPAVETNLDYDPAAPAPTVTLEQAEKFIRSKWPVRWWTEESEPGEWIQFETKLVHGVIEDRRGTRSILFFWGRDVPDDETSPQLVLHGSARHLLLGPGQTRTDGIAESLVSGLFGYLRGVEDGSIDFANADWYEDQLNDVVHRLRGISPDFTAGWLSGMARVSFSAGRRMVVASPLFVEYTPAPK